jgi:hypothetical protein
VHKIQVAGATWNPYPSRPSIEEDAEENGLSSSSSKLQDVNPCVRVTGLGGAALNITKS